MATETLSKEALAVIDGYLHFRLGAAVSSVPYFNNKTVRARGAMNAVVGKGSPREIYDEAEMLAFKNHAKPEALTGEALKKLLADNNIGIDCSALAFYTLDAESRARGKGSVKKHLHFIRSFGLVGTLLARLRPANITDVSTLASDVNSRTITIREVTPGDMITMLGGPDSNDRNHILIVHQVDRDGSGNAAPSKIYYTHAVAYPEDGIYGSGIKQGVIEIAFPDKGILDQVWKENGTPEGAARIFTRAQTSKTELRRLKWL